MKHPLLELIKLMFILAVTFSLGMVVSIWLITPEPISQEVYIKYGVIGAIVGLWGGAGTWLILYLQIRRHSRK
ncbi:hypothetical protein AB6T85_03665 [Erwinia sp. ACCC 02193]|uniref:Uncharacterized protein n=1 Tax=Erwinia aeris TaxID=3239803 RepID=A0ABV4E3Q4_9GAMM|nr:hypothetical protein [Erwinia sp. BC051422]MDN8543926.1 hypothetical protein [Erwinia sp. BC051422]